jgi:alpha-L-rhamnosidase
MIIRLCIVRYAILFTLLLPVIRLCGQNNLHANPWVHWYWREGAVSKHGITANLEAMQQAGIGGAWLRPVKDTSAALPSYPVIKQLTPEWWAMVNFAMQEAKRLHLQLVMNVSDYCMLSDGFRITPELSAQKLVWTKEYVTGGTGKEQRLEQPPAVENYYKDIAVFAYPANSLQAFSDTVQVPTVTTSNGVKATFLCFDAERKETFTSDTACWIQYKYPRLFTCRSIRIRTGSSNYLVQPVMIQVSNDGIYFRTISTLEPTRYGRQDMAGEYTHSIQATTAKYFRFVYDKISQVPGAADPDTAKWKFSVRLAGIYLSDEPFINQFEAKNGSGWGITAPATAAQITGKDAISLKNIINLTDKMDSDGKLHWTVPAGNWVIIRIGHTSTGHIRINGNEVKGLECDKFNPVAVKLQFDNWYKKTFEKTGKNLVQQVFKIFYVNIREYGSQNWNNVFLNEFKKRRGYDLGPYLLTMTGVPVENPEVSEKILLDVRETIAGLLNDNFYATLKKLAHEKEVSFSIESVTSEMQGEGGLQDKNAAIPAGEFWLNGPGQ